MSYHQNNLSKINFSHLISSPGTTCYEHLACNENVILEECFSYLSGFSKSWLLNHHYALQNRCIDYNYIPSVKLFNIQSCSLMQPFFEVAIGQKLIWESFHSKFATENYLFNNLNTYNLISNQKTVDLDLNNCLFIIPHRWYNSNYYHWTIETLARFRVWQKAKQKIRDLKLVIHKFKANSFQDQWLRLMQIKENDCLFIGNNENYNIKNALYCASIGTNHCSYFNVDLISQLIPSEVNANVVKLKNSLKYEKIFVCRKKNSVRSIQNHDEILKIMQSHGFKVIYGEDYSVLEQIEIFKAAQYIVGIHGSGLANIIFSSSDSRVLEIMPSSSINPCFFDLANAKRQSYGYMVCQCSGIKNGQLIYINPTMLNDHLDILLYG